MRCRGRTGGAAGAPPGAVFGPPARVLNYSVGATQYRSKCLTIIPLQFRRSGCRLRRLR